MKKNGLDGSGMAWLRTVVEAKPWPEECVVWTGRLNSYGYGAITIGREKGTHRLAYELAYGPIPDGLQVLHGKDRTCVSRACCNPAHLRVGTIAENMADKARDGTLAVGDRNGARLHPERLARGDRSGARLHPESMKRGSENGNAKLREEDVREIRRLCAAGVKQGVVAGMFNISQAVISQIVNRRTWKQV